MSDHQIAEYLGVSAMMVGKYRDEPTINGLQSPHRTGLDGRTIDTSNIARRNLSDEQKSYLRGKRYQAEKKEEGRPEKPGNSCQVNGETRERLAEKYDVSARTIQNDAAYAEAVDANAGRASAAGLVAGARPRSDG